MANAKQIIPRSQKDGIIDKKPRDTKKMWTTFLKKLRKFLPNAKPQNDNEQQWTIQTNDGTTAYIPIFTAYGNLAWVCESMNIRRD